LGVDYGQQRHDRQCGPPLPQFCEHVHTGGFVRRDDSEIFVKRGGKIQPRVDGMTAGIQPSDQTGA